jgi:hypothetical protein
MATTIRLKRDSGYADRLRKYRVLLDGQEIGRIGDGEEKVFEITSGQHQLVVKVDWAKTPAVSFVAGQGQTAKFSCGSNLRGFRLIFALYYAIFASGKYLWLRAG